MSFFDDFRFTECKKMQKMGFKFGLRKMGFKFMSISLKRWKYDYQEWYKKRSDDEELHNIQCMPPLKSDKKILCTSHAKSRRRSKRKKRIVNLDSKQAINQTSNSISTNKSCK